VKLVFVKSVVDLCKKRVLNIVHGQALRKSGAMSSVAREATDGSMPVTRRGRG
jgi:hypothetical protein